MMLIGHWCRFRLDIRSYISFSIFQQIKDCLESHLFLEEKKNKDIKERIVGGGNKQRSYVSKQEASSPTSHTESVFCTIGIEVEN